MIGLKKLIDNIDITILNAELYAAGKEWNYKNVNNPYSRLYYVTEGTGIIHHHHKKYNILRKVS